MAYYITDHCVGCSVCEIKCPVWAISGKKKELYVIDPGTCIDCGACAIWCPYDAITDSTGNLIQGLKAKDIPKAAVIDEHCCACDYCLDVCPFDAIVYKTKPNDSFNKIASVIPNKCVACKLCEEICGYDAIYVPEMSYNILETRSPEEWHHFAKPKMAQKEPVTAS